MWAPEGLRLFFVWHPVEVTAGRDKRGLVGFGLAFARPWGAVLGATLGFALMMAGVTAPLDEAEAWWEYLISIPLGLAVVAAGCALAVVSVGGALERVALGYWGILLGTCPAGVYGPSPGNREQAWASGLFAALALGLGAALFRVGAREGELNWTLEGLLLAFSGLLLGLGGLVPRLYFWRRPKERRIRELELPDSWAAFVVAASLGVGLSFGVCNGVAETTARAERARLKDSRASSPDDALAPRRRR